MLFVACASTFVTLPFFLLGAWPIVGFMGLNVVIFYLGVSRQFPRRPRL